MAVGDVILKAFDIELPNGQSWTNELYANGRHQCQLNVLVQKQVENADGHFIDTPLTTTERNSATITAYGFPGAVLPRGWSCDRTKNQFDVGLRPLGTEEPMAEIKPVDNSFELIKLYVRAGTSASMGTERLMAKMVVGGKTYTTNGAGGGAPFQSYVDIQLTSPYRLEISELSTYVDVDAYSHGHNGVDIDIYYMTPTVKGIRFVENRGLDSPVVVNGEGSHFHTSYVKHTNNGVRFKGGVVMVENGRLTVDKIQKNNGSGEVLYNKLSTIMRAARYRGWMDTPDDDRQSGWRLWDNYGCEHIFFIGWADSGNVLALRT
ncbi:hypothetical protein CI807_11860 [Pseudomonas sp. NS1(2017)]|jgi:hypothetical protein|uniref:hypothetical protein n=1 Tax=Pseudomonas sp. NS1(2017) TaxID=2025658 RepID=UPI000BA2B420|nr:hypothetical protein [Pseudomonas sp. NS1(2017)]ASV36846.1 hypothetical protein CI807_11860 [Pseudomonas sp. NS1(2017)]